MLTFTEIEKYPQDGSKLSIFPEFVHWRHWNQLMDHALKKPASFIFGISASGYYEAIYGKGSNQAGKRAAELATDFGELFNAVASLIGSQGALFSLLDYEFLTETTLQWKHGLVAEGMGNSTIIKQADGANLNELINIYLNGTEFGRFQIKNMVLDGNKANQTAGNGYGIKSDTYSSVTMDYTNLRDLLIKDTRGIGVETNGNYHNFDNVVVYQAGGDSFVIKDYHAKLIGCISNKGAASGVILRGTGLHELIGFKAIGNDLHGVVFSGEDTSGPQRSAMIGGELLSNDGHGIYFYGGKSNRVIAPYIENSSYATADTYDNIHFGSYSTRYSTRNMIMGAHLRNNLNKARYHVRENDGNQDYNRIIRRIIDGSGVTGDVSLQGLNSEDVA